MPDINMSRLMTQTPSAWLDRQLLKLYLCIPVMFSFIINISQFFTGEFVQKILKQPVTFSLFKMLKYSVKL